MARTSLAELVSRDEGLEAVMDDRGKAEFETAAAAMVDKGMRSEYCHIGWCDRILLASCVDDCTPADQGMKIRSTYRPQNFVVAR